MKFFKYLAIFTAFILFTGGPAIADQALFQKALKSDREGFFEDAITDWKKFLDSNPEKEPRLFAGIKLSLVYFKVGKLDEAMNTAMGIVNAEPENFHANFNLANILSEIKNLKSAEKAYAKVALLDPDEGLGHVGLALCQFGNGNPDAAVEKLKEVKELFKRKKNISWHRDVRYMIHQMKNFAIYPPDFSNLWLTNNLKMVRDTYEKKILRRLEQELKL